MQQSKTPSLSDIAHELRNDPERYAPMILGEKPNALQSRPGTELRFYEKGGLVVCLKGSKRGKWFLHGQDKWGDMLDLIMYAKNLDKISALQEAKRILGIADGVAYVPTPRISSEDALKQEKEDREKRLRAAAFIWRKSSPKIGPGALAYLKGRGIDILEKEAFPAIRHRYLTRDDLEKMKIDPAPFPKGLTALVVAATLPDGTVTTVQQILLDGDRKAGIKDPKRSNGLMKASGGAVKIGPAPTDKVILAEGPETGFSCYQATKVPTWIMLGSSNLTTADIPESVPEVLIAVDLEPSRAGTVSALKAAAYWMAKGKTVRLVIPDAKLPGIDDEKKVDINDVLKAAGEDAVRRTFEDALSAERNPFRGKDGALRDASEVPVVMMVSADDALAAWTSTGLPSIATCRQQDLVDQSVPEHARKAIWIAIGDEKAPALDKLKEVEARLLRISSPLADVRHAGDGEAVRKVLGFAAKPSVRLPYAIEQLAINRDCPVILANGLRTLTAAKEAFPAAAVCGFSSKAAIGAYDWSSLKGRQVVFVPSAGGREDALKKAAECASAGAACVRVMGNPSIAPAPGGWRHVGGTEDGVDLDALMRAGWMPSEIQAFAMTGGTTVAAA